MPVPDAFIEFEVRLMLSDAYILIPYAFVVAVVETVLFAKRLNEHPVDTAIPTASLPVDDIVLPIILLDIQLS